MPDFYSLLMHDLDLSTLGLLCVIGITPVSCGCQDGFSSGKQTLPQGVGPVQLVSGWEQFPDPRAEAFRRSIGVQVFGIPDAVWQDSDLRILARKAVDTLKSRLDVVNSSFSPNGSLLAIATERQTGKLGLWLLQAGDAEPTEVSGAATWTEYRSILPSFSPDGSIAIVLAVKGAVRGIVDASGYPEPGRCDIYKLSAPHWRLEEWQTIGPIERKLPLWSWAQGGQALYFPIGQEHKNEIWRIDMEKKSSRMVFSEPRMRADGRTNHPCLWVLPSPDEHYLATLRGSETLFDKAIWLVDVSAGEIQQITWQKERKYQHWPTAWSPDGNTLTFTRTADGGDETWRDETWSIDLSQLFRAGKSSAQNSKMGKK